MTEGSKEQKFWYGAGAAAAGAFLTVQGGLEMLGGGLAAIPTGGTTLLVSGHGATAAAAGVEGLGAGVSMMSQGRDYDDGSGKRGRKGESFRGGSKKDRDQWYGYNNKDFQRWWHRTGKKEYGEGDLDNEHEAKRAYDDWVARGEPKVD